MFEQNPGETSVLNEVVASLVPLRFDGSESEFWKNKTPPVGYIKKTKQIKSSNFIFYSLFHLTLLK